MRPVNVFQMEILSVFADVRSLLMRFGVAFLMGFPFALAAMPLQVRVSGLTMLMVFTAFFGAAVGSVRRRTDGINGRLGLLPIHPAVLQSDLLLSGAVIDLMQVGAVLGVYVLVNAGTFSFPRALFLTGAVVVTVLPLNLLGMALGAVLQKNAEVHLFAALGTGCIALLSGVIPVPARLAGFVKAVSLVNPVSWTVTALRQVADSQVQYGIGVSIAVSGILSLVAAWTIIRSLKQ